MEVIREAVASVAGREGRSDLILRAQHPTKEGEDWNQVLQVSSKVPGPSLVLEMRPNVLRLMRRIDDHVPKDLAVHLVLDNYGTHKTPAVQRWFGAHPRFELHFTPTSASWLNGVERFFAEITRRRIRRGTFTSVASLERAISEYLSVHNEHAKPFVWTATADTIFDKIVHHCSLNS